MPKTTLGATSASFLFFKYFIEKSILVREQLDMVSGQLPPLPPRGKLPPPVRVGVCFKVRVSFRVRGNQAIAAEKDCLPARVRVWLRVSFGVVGQFSPGQLF